VLAGPDGGLVGSVRGKLAVANDDEVTLLKDIRDRLDILISVLGR
jgi:hypothetical protein